jgi:hypothetical protein
VTETDFSVVKTGEGRYVVRHTSGAQSGGYNRTGAETLLFMLHVMCAARRMAH